MNEMYPSKYLKASDIEGHEPIVTIRRIEIEELGQGEEKDTKPVLYFDGKDKGLALNVTNATVIALIYNSDDSDDWIGRKIKLYVDIVAYKGKATKAIRVKNAEALAPKVTQPVKKDLPGPMEVNGPATRSNTPDLEDDQIPF